MTGKDASDPSIFEEKKPAPPPEPKKPIIKVEPKKAKFFSVHDKRCLETSKPDSATTVKIAMEKNQMLESIKDIVPVTGSIYHSLKSPGLSAPLKKELREKGSYWNAVSEVSPI